MTLNQQKKYEQLRDKIQQTFEAWLKNTDKAREDALHKEWLKAMEKCESFEEKHL